MEKIELIHGGEEYDSKYPKGIPTRVNIITNNEEIDSGLIMYPHGHARD